jgi:antitoxin HigA-1
MRPSHRPPTSPGEMLLEEFLKPRGITVQVAATSLGISITQLNDLIHGTRGITPATARQLAKWLDTTPEFWMSLQGEETAKDR